MNTQMQTQTIEHLNRIDLRLTALELCANYISRVVTKIDARTRKLIHQSHRLPNDEQQRLCYELWELAKHNDTLRGNRKVTFAAAYAYYARELMAANITNAKLFANAVRSYSRLLKRQRHNQSLEL